MGLILENGTFWATLLSYGCSLLLLTVRLFIPQDRLAKWSKLILKLAFCGHTLCLLLRSLNVGHAPFTSLYESLLIFSWGTSVCTLIIERRYRTAHLSGFSVPLILAALLGSLATNSSSAPLLPVLRSPWLVVHVFLAILAYGAFATAAAAAASNLWQHHRHPNLAWQEDEPLSQAAHQLIGWGFPLMVLVIITGSIWAQKAWGSYWQWDPKETWGLITAMLYGAYLHWHQSCLSRKEYTNGRLAQSSALFAIIGFIVVLFCYLGVNLLLSGLHSYASQ